jgi:hypothetical protein
MYVLDRLLAAASVAQVVLMSLRAGSRAVFLLREGKIGSTDEGTPILPPSRRNETSFLWDLSTAFRESIKLGIEREKYGGDIEWIIDTAAGAPSSDAKLQSSDPYFLSMSPVKVQKEEMLTFEEVIRRSVLDYDVAVSIATEVGLRNPTHVRNDDNDPKERKQRTARIRAFAPTTFSILRSYFGISEDSFRKGVLESGRFSSFQSNSKGAARVGGVFFFTRDGAYFIKTIKRDEMHMLLRMLSKYTDFMKTNGRQSLLTRFCGLYEIALEDGTYYVLVTNAVFPAEASRIVTERFDLKGSTVGRKTSVEERGAMGSKAVLKDLDLHREIERDLSKQLKRERVDSEAPIYGLHIGPVAKAALLSQLRLDVELLKECQVIDYSLLVGVACNRKGKSRKSVAWSPLLPYYGSDLCGIDAGTLSKLTGKRRGKPAIFYFGVIDFLQPFNYKKTAEWRFKSLMHEKDTFSCVPPKVYAERFLTFLDEHMT